MRHFLNGVEIAPRNLDEIGFVSDYTDNPEVDSISVDSVILPREAKKIIQDHIQNVGLFEGIPYQIETDGVTLEYYVDFLGGIKIRDNDIEVNIKKRKSIDDFFERAKGSSFEILNTNGVQFTSHDVPYFVIPDNQFELSLQLAVVTFIMFKETYEAGERFGEALNLLTEAGTPIPVVVFPSAGVGFNVPAIVGNILKVIITLIYFA